MTGDLRDIIAGNDIFFSSIVGLIPVKYLSTDDQDDMDDGRILKGRGERGASWKKPAGQAKQNKRLKLGSNGTYMSTSTGVDGLNAVDNTMEPESVLVVQPDGSKLTLKLPEFAGKYCAT